VRVLRFWNSELAEDFDQVCWTILSACRESDPARRGERIKRGR
jgi:very-short-patch-repair endonuclease